MVKKIIEGAIALLLIVGIIWQPEAREYLIPSLTFVIGWIFKAPIETVSKGVVGLFRKG